MSKKYLCSGLIGIIITSLLTITLRSLNFWLFPILLGLFLAVSFALVFTEKNFFLSFIIFLLIAGTSMTIVFQQKYNIIGFNAHNINVSEISNSPFYSTYTFKDAKVLKENLGFKLIYSRWKTVEDLQGRIYLAPLVDQNWKTGDLVHAWVATALNDKNQDLAKWEKSHNAALRLSGGWIDDYDDLTKYRDIIPEIEKTYGIHSAPNAPILRWIQNPKTEIQYARILYIKIILSALLTWVLLFFLQQKIYYKKN